MRTEQYRATTGKTLRLFVGGVCAVFGLHTSPAWANSIAVTNTAILDAPVSGQSFIQFDVSWSNSWRATWTEPGANNVTGSDLDLENWDAAWVFAKYRLPGSSGWKHATLSDTSGNHQKPSGAALDVGLTSGNGVGVFVYRNAVGNGPINFENIRLRWLHAADGVTDTGTVDVAVHAIEMVYVPQGMFAAGYTNDGVTIGHAYLTNWFHAAGNTRSPHLVSSESEQTIYWLPEPNSATLPAAFPKGYNAFYCMKHPITQGQYTDFLNALSPDQSVPRVDFALLGTLRNTIGFNGSIFTNGAPDRVCNFLSWHDVAAYAAWTGLRPMTELEFEKAGRGPRLAQVLEFAWGDSSGTNLGTINDDGTGRDTPALATANINRSTGHTAARAGIFARPTSGRQLSGASYWGVLDMSGMPGEQIVTAGHAEGRLFTGMHGAGNLSTGGEADVSGWPGKKVFDATTAWQAQGAGIRGYTSNPGGGRQDGPSYLASRYESASVLTVRYGSVGGRAVRTAP